MTSPLNVSTSLLESVDDPPVDFMSLSVLSRPSDHFALPHERRATTTTTASTSGNPSNPYQPPPRRRHMTPHQFASRFVQDPFNTTLSYLSKVPNFILASNEDYESAIDDLISSRTEARQQQQEQDNAEPTHILESYCPPPPALPIISCENPFPRLEKLTEEEFQAELSNASTKEILTRVFRGGIDDYSLKRKLWPLILGLTDDWRNFDWQEKETLFTHYFNQWQSILPDQESRFTAYRERKSIAERDVIRCDRNHPFYTESTGNLDKLKSLLLSYVMYDFDTGYVQGMTDLASPLLFAYDGQVGKAFWIFVQVMDLFRNNFEMSQKTISFQLSMLWKLIKVTDPVFANFLKSKESDNCYFAFRWIICLFKREFMKGKTDGYDDCLLVWETVWAATALRNLNKRDTQSAQNNSSVQNKDSSSLSNSNSSTPVMMNDLNVGCVNGNHSSSNCQANKVSPSLQFESSVLLGNHTSILSDSLTRNTSNGEDLIDVRSPSITPTQETPPSTSPPGHESTIDLPVNTTSDSTENIQCTEQPLDGTCKSTPSATTPIATPTQQQQQPQSSSPQLDVDSVQCNEEHLSDVQLFVLCICLSIIRRERDLLMAQKSDAPEILKHFNTLNLNDDLNSILLHASTIWSWLKDDGGEEALNAPEVVDDKRHDSSGEDFDLLNDEFMLVTTMNV